MRKILKSAASLVTGAALAVSVTAMAELPASAASSCSASFDNYSTIISTDHLILMHTIGGKSKEQIHLTNCRYSSVHKWN